MDTHAQLGKLVEVREQLPDLKKVVLCDGASRAGDSFVLGFERPAQPSAPTGSADDPGAVNERSSQVRPTDLATIVYTSGTTGPPKGAMISHANIMWTVRTVTPVYGIGEGDRLLSFLPLSHIAERMMSDFMPIAVTGETWFARSLATVAEDLPCLPADRVLGGAEGVGKAARRRRGPPPGPAPPDSGRSGAVRRARPAHVAADQDGTAETAGTRGLSGTGPHARGDRSAATLGLDQSSGPDHGRGARATRPHPLVPRDRASPRCSSTARPRAADRRRPTGPTTSGSARSDAALPGMSRQDRRRR